MKIALIAWKDNEVDLFKDLALSLSKRISGLEIEERFVPFIADLPLVAKECCGDSDFVFVFAVVEDVDESRVIIEKLIDVEIATGTRILKAITDETISGMDEGDYLDSKRELVLMYADLIVNILFNERAFEPQDKDFGL